MASLDIPLSTANSIYTISLVILIISIVLVLVSTASMIWTGLIKERYASQKIAQDEAAAAKAKADADEAHKELVAVKATAAKLQQEKQKAMSDDRQISPEKRAKFKDYVQNFPKGKIFVGTSTTDPEALSYAKQIYDMLADAGYQVVPKSGLLLPPETEFTGVHVRIRSMADQPYYAGSLQKGLEFIDIDTAGELDDAAEDAVLILVGNKP
jgi:hypothetical protein